MAGPVNPNAGSQYPTMRAMPVCLRFYLNLITGVCLQDGDAGGIIVLGQMDILTHIN